MSSEVKRMDDLIKSLTSDIKRIKHVVDSKSLRMTSIASVTSVSDNISECSVSIVDSTQTIDNVPIILSTNEINKIGYIKIDDIVLVSHNYNYTNPLIIKKIKSEEEQYQADKNMKVTNRVQLSVMSA